jgi:hypothetical protein
MEDIKDLDGPVSLLQTQTVTYLPFYTTTYTMNLRTGPGPDLHFKEQYGQLIVDKLDKNFDVSDENTRIIGLPLHKSSPQILLQSDNLPVVLLGRGCAGVQDTRIDMQGLSMKIDLENHDAVWGTYKSLYRGVAVFRFMECTWLP